ncbi:MAG: Ribosomal RNA small subunit methyltransferase D [Candidatus Omnitrophica bacterium]|nr:Ribosomal RNA small subunit methyltransferase D [Candidatus Omnitrophota bacterium]
MRVLTGALKGREIRFKPMPGVRPTADKVRKSMVDTLVASLPGAEVLDLFAGSGAIGFEALSNGALRVDLVEADRDRARCVQDNAERLGVAKSCQVSREDAFEAVRRLHGDGRVYDLVFADPPYRSGDAARILEHLKRYPLLRSGGIAVIECADDERIESQAQGGGLTLLRSRSYGGSKVVYFRASPDPAPGTGTPN